MAIWSSWREPFACRDGDAVTWHGTGIKPTGRGTASSWRDRRRDARTEARTTRTAPPLCSSGTLTSTAANRAGELLAAGLERSDSRATCEAVHVAGGTAILELTWRGTHSGPLQTPAGQIPATGKPIELQARQIVELRDGRSS